MKTHWKSLEELSGFPEFQVDDDDKNGVTRREFLKFMGASLVMAGVATACRRPVEKIVPYLNQPEEITPGIANWYASTCGECPSACGLLAKTREGRPIKLEGNPEHPMNRGGLCARGQASLLNLYDPDRLKNPVKKGADGRWEALSWQKADEGIQNILKAIREKKGKVRLLTDTIVSPSTQKLLNEFLAPFGDAKQISFEPLSLENLAAAQKDSYGEAIVPRYRFDQADYILSFGADFLDTWISPVEFAKQFSKGRKPSDGKMSRFVAFESVPTATGSNADLHIPVAFGEELKIALALAHEVSTREMPGGAATGALTPYAAEAVAEQTGVDAQILKRIAKELWNHRGRSLVLGGSTAPSGAEGKALHVAVNFLNSILGNDGKTIDAKNSPSLQGAPQSAGGRAALDEWISELKNGGVDCLFIHKTNPSYVLGEEFDQALEKAGVVVRLSDRIDETALKAHWVLPLSHFLESWGDAEPQRGLYSLVQPSIQPLYETRSFPEILLGWMGNKISWHDTLQNFWKENIFPKAGGFVSFTAFWETALRGGVFDTRKSLNGHAPRSFDPAALQAAAHQLPSVLRQIPAKNTGAGPMLVAYPTIPHYDGRSQNNGWLMELPDPVTKITWRNYVSIAPKKAAELGLKEGDVVRVRNEKFTAELPVHLQPGLHEKVFAVPLGFGHTQIGRVGNGVGVNAFRFGAAAAASLEKTGGWIRLASTQQHHSLEGRPIVHETTLKEYQKNPAAGNEPVPLPTMWSGHKYEGYRWGMAIDLNACTGCSACMIACQAENNIPVVGEKQILKGREMHWIRIDRYYSGDADNPETLNQPMLCQHCENAPCETVCPVVATLHNEEGLNVQAYNRCVGTRYCSNNCPYKVRRFNWFEYLRSLETPMSMVLNPDVTVREKGVMEKCSFCVQRIQEGKDKAKDLSTKEVTRKVLDGEIQTACQQSCPAEAIIFGDLNDPESRVSQLAKNPRGYNVLAELNARPSITYLTKVRNKAQS